MDCTSLVERLAESWDGALSDARRSDLEAHLSACERCRREARILTETWDSLGLLPDESPSPALRLRFETFLDAWREGQRDAGAVVPLRARSPRLRARPLWQLAVAAVVCLAVGFAAGRGAGGRPSTDTAELAELRAEVRGMKQLVALSLLQQQSATERLRGVSWSHQLERPGDEVIGALLETLRYDPNVNVRLSAVDALTQFAEMQSVRSGLVEALRRQDSPLVQIALIDTMVELGERRSIPLLQTLATDVKANDVVRKRASWGVSKLS